MEELAFKTAVELASGIRNKTYSSLELTQLYIDRIEEKDEHINAVVVRIFDRALEAARQADVQLTKGEIRGPLHGVPMTIKESYVIANTPTTFGLEEFRNNVPKQDGLTVLRFKAAGAHFLGKTNVPVSLADFQSYNPIYGVTGNPWNLEKILDLFPQLSARIDNMANLLSGGEQQMLAIGRSLMTNPKLLLLDEATEGLAPLVRREIWRCLNQLKKEGISILVVDKNVNDLARIADMHYVIEKGRIVWEGTSPELLEQKDFLGNKLGV